MFAQLFTTHIIFYKERFIRNDFWTSQIFENVKEQTSHFFEKKSAKKIKKNTYAKYFSKKKVGAKPPLLPAGPRLISSDSEISA